MNVIIYIRDYTLSKEIIAELELVWHHNSLITTLPPQSETKVFRTLQHNTCRQKKSGLGGWGDKIDYCFFPHVHNAYCVVWCISRQNMLKASSLRSMNPFSAPSAFILTICCDSAQDSFTIVCSRSICVHNSYLVKRISHEKLNTKDFKLQVVPTRYKASQRTRHMQTDSSPQVSPLRTAKLQPPWYNPLLKLDGL